MYFIFENILTDTPHSSQIADSFMASHHEHSLINRHKTVFEKPVQISSKEPVGDSRHCTKVLRRTSHGKNTQHTDCGICWASNAVFALLILTLISTLTEASRLRTLESQAVAPRRSGMMKLCPPGGESFASAWQMACGMRRRKKRDMSEVIHRTDINRKKSVQDEALQIAVGPAIGKPELAKSRKNDVKPATSRQKRDAFGDTYYSYNSAINAPQASSNSYEPFAPTADDSSPSMMLEPNSVELNLLSTGKNKSPSVSSSSTAQFIPSEMAELLSELNNRGSNDAVDTVPSSDTVLSNSVNGDDDEGGASFRAPSISEIMMVCCRYGCSLRDLLPYCSPFGDWDSYY